MTRNVYPLILVKSNMDSGIRQNEKLRCHWQSQDKGRALFKWR